MIKVSVISQKSQGLPNNLLWFKGNGKFQLRISKNKYLIFFSFTLMDPEAFKT